MIKPFQPTPEGCTAAKQYLKKLKVHISERLSGWDIVSIANYMAEYPDINRLRHPMKPYR